MLKIKDLSFSYNKNNNILNDVTFISESKKITGILGHNGAGKTTLFKCILGILKSDRGKIEIISSNEIRNSSYKQNISYLPDTGGFYPLLSPLKNLEFRSSFNKNKKQGKEEALKWLEKLKLNTTKVKLSGNLSHGMQKRLSFACCMVNDPDIILLDEPTNGLDPESTNLIINLVNEMNQKNKTILINTHDLNLVKEICYKIILLQNGKVISENRVSDINKNLREFYMEKVDIYNKGNGDENV